MPEPTLTTLDPEQREAVHKARDAAHALEVARKVQQEETANMVREQMIDVLSMGSEPAEKRAVVIGRIPYICNDIRDINHRFEKLDTRFEKIEKSLRYSPLIQALVFGMVTIILIAVVTAFVGLVITK